MNEDQQYRIESEIDRLFYNFVDNIFMSRVIDFNDEDQTKYVLDYLNNFDIRDGVEEGLDEFNE